MQVSSPHFVLSPNELLDYLSKLLVTLRDATHSAIRASEEAVSKALADGNQEAAGRITELEGSLAAMQAELDVARTDIVRISASERKEREERDAAMNGVLEDLHIERKEVKKMKSELRELKKAHDLLQAQSSEDKKAWKQDRARLQKLSAELENLKRSAGKPLESLGFSKYH